MAQQQNKKIQAQASSAAKQSQAFAQAAAKNAAKFASIAGGAANSKFESNVNNFLENSTKAFEEAFFNASTEAKKFQEKFAEFANEGADHLTKGADTASKAINEAIELSKENFEAISESADISSKISQSIANEISDFANEIASENLKAFEKFLGCKTASDFFNLQSNLFKANADAAFNQALKVSELCMQFSKAAEPVSEKIQESAERLTKSLTNSKK